MSGLFYEPHHSTWRSTGDGNLAQQHFGGVRLPWRHPLGEEVAGYANHGYKIENQAGLG